MKRIIQLTLLISALFISCTSFARPLKGFNTGPYLCLGAGVTQVTFDKDEQRGKNVGRDFEPALEILFGWNVWDWLSAELEGGYGTNIYSGKREHIVNVNVSTKYFMIMDALTNFESLRIMPFVKGGFSFRIAALPGNINSSDTVISKFGWGPSLGGGVSFLWKKYLSFGFTAQEDLLFFDDTRQKLDLNGYSANDVLIYKGGLYPQFSAMGFVGVHY